MQKLDLQKIRLQIDVVDKQLATILEQRLELVLQVAEYKKAHGMPVKDVAREAKVIAKVTGLLNNKNYTPAVANIMRCIIEQACILEEDALQEKTEVKFRQ